MPQRDARWRERHHTVSLPAETVAEGVQRLGWLALAYVIADITGPSARLALAAAAGAVDRSDFGIPGVFGQRVGLLECEHPLESVVRRLTFDDRGEVQSGRR
jgi:hypothetical protein